MTTTHIPPDEIDLTPATCAGLIVILAVICLILLPLYAIVSAWNWVMPSHLANGGLDRPL